MHLLSGCRLGRDSYAFAVWLQAREGRRRKRGREGWRRGGGKEGKWREGGQGGEREGAKRAEEVAPLIKPSTSISPKHPMSAYPWLQVSVRTEFLGVEEGAEFWVMVEQQEAE